MTNGVKEWMRDREGGDGIVEKREEDAVAAACSGRADET